MGNKNVKLIKGDTIIWLYKCSINKKFQPHPHCLKMIHMIKDMVSTEYTKSVKRKTNPKSHHIKTSLHVYAHQHSKLFITLFNIWSTFSVQSDEIPINNNGIRIFWNMHIYKLLREYLQSIPIFHAAVKKEMRWQIFHYYA